MENIKYRLKFSFIDIGDEQFLREFKLSLLLQEIRPIETNTQLVIPTEGSKYMINGVEYSVRTVTTSVEFKDDVIYYDTILELLDIGALNNWNKIKHDREEALRKEEQAKKDKILREMLLRKFGKINDPSNYRLDEDDDDMFFTF